MLVAKNHALYDRVTQKGLHPAHVVEIGVNEPQFSNVYGFILDGVRTTLVEPEPEAFIRIKQHFSERENVTLYACALYDFEGEVELFKKGQSTFVSGLPLSPVLVNEGYLPNEQDKFAVKATTFSTIDDGTIALLSIDTEGSEWYVIKHLISRPMVISVETHGNAYVNPFLASIKNWMSGEGYRIWYKSKTDTVFIKDGAFSITLAERLKLVAMCLRLCFRYARGRLKNKIKSLRASSKTSSKAD